ncbi:MAG: hypothetical protein U9N87_11870 [Planctomycetota bacterium]|nr:hypothetical protein [Planctomycetota bacterium]
MISTNQKSRSEQFRGPVVPELTGLQFLVVSLLFDGEKTSNELRAELRRRGYTSSKPAFSRMMKRMIKSAIVIYGCRDKGKGDGSTLEDLKTQNIYEVSDLGVLLWRGAREFYGSIDPPPDDIKAVEVAVTKYAKHGRRKRKEMADAEFKKQFMGLFDRIIEDYSER